MKKFAPTLSFSIDAPILSRTGPHSQGGFSSFDLLLSSSFKEILLLSSSSSLLPATLSSPLLPLFWYFWPALMLFNEEDDVSSRELFPCFRVFTFNIKISYFSFL